MLVLFFEKQKLHIILTTFTIIVYMYTVSLGKIARAASGSN